jgi:eukaryotic-like serine/threonine-protein kinase
MAPEQLTRQPIDRRVDVFTAGIVLWEALTGKPLFESDDVGSALNAILHAPIEAPSAFDERIPPNLDNVVLRALARDPRQRFATAREFAEALRIAMPPATPQQVTQWLTQTCGGSLQQRAAVVADIEAETLGDDWPPKHLLALRTPVVTNDTTAVKTSNGTRNALGAGLLLAAFVGTATWFVSSRNQAVLPASLPVPMPVAELPAKAESPPVAPVEPPVVVKAEVPESVPQSPPTKGPPKHMARTRRTAKPAVAVKPPAAPAKAPVGTKANCEIPWVIGPNGVKTPKAGCF